MIWEAISARLEERFTSVPNLSISLTGFTTADFAAWEEARDTDV